VDKLKGYGQSATGRVASQGPLDRSISTGDFQRRLDDVVKSSHQPLKGPSLRDLVHGIKSIIDSE
jgi:hypothetical protein